MTADVEVEGPLRAPPAEFEACNGDLAGRGRERDAFGDLEHLIEHGPVVMVRLNADRSLTYVSRNARAVIGCDPTMLRGERVDALTHPDDVERLRERLVNAISNAMPGAPAIFETEFRMLDDTGEYRWIRGVFRVAVDDTASPAHAFGYLVDVTEVRARDEALRRHVAALDLMRGVAIAANESHDVQEALAFVLEALCADGGWPVGHALVVDGPTGELTSTGLWRLPAPDAFPELRRTSEDATFPPAATSAPDQPRVDPAGVDLPGLVVTSTEPFWIEDLRRRPELSRHEAYERDGMRCGFAFPVLIADEVVAALEFFGQCPSPPDARLIELSLGIGAQLGRVFERERAGRALTEAKEQAERANRSKSEFLSRMSHELRTPLNAIIGFGQLLALDHPDEDDDSIAQILKGGRHLLDLINDVLDIARVEAGRMSLSIEPVGMADVLGDAVDLIRPAAAARATNLEWDPDLAANLYVLADGQRLRQVLLNLFSNAVKYGGDEGTITIGYEVRDNDRLRITIRDRGPGVESGDLERVFAPFERLDADRLGIEGSGLGLALSKVLAEAMDGSIGLDSDDGQGAVAWIELPLAEAPEGTGIGPTTSQRLPAPLLSQPFAVLYIEDNLSNLRLIDRVLAHRPNVTLLSAMQGSLGLDLAREHRPDLVLLDVHLPDMRGDEVLRQLQADPVTQDLPVVVLSADVTQRQRDRLMQAGARQYLTKPVNVSELLGLLDELMVEAAS